MCKATERAKNKKTLRNCENKNLWEGTAER